MAIRLSEGPNRHDHQSRSQKRRRRQRRRRGLRDPWRGARRQAGRGSASGARRALAWRGLARRGSAPSRNSRPPPRVVPDVHLPVHFACCLALGYSYSSCSVRGHARASRRRSPGCKARGNQAPRAEAYPFLTTGLGWGRCAVTSATRPTTGVGKAQKPAGQGHRRCPGNSKAVHTARPQHAAPAGRGPRSGTSRRTVRGLRKTETRCPLSSSWSARAARTR